MQEPSSTPAQLPPEADRIVSRIVDPQLRERFKDLLVRAVKDGEDVAATLGDLVDAVDESVFSVTDWANALLALVGWLEDNERQPEKLQAMLGYVACCADFAANRASSGELAMIVESMLLLYGFEGGESGD